MPRPRMVIAGPIVLTCLAGHARAGPPPDADPALAPWFNGLRQPWTNALCCSVADCRTVDSRLNNGRYEALIEGEWHPVPDDHILNRGDNPTGRAVACWTPQGGSSVSCAHRTVSSRRHAVEEPARYRHADGGPPYTSRP